MQSERGPSGRLVKAPESFIDAAGVRQVFAEAKQGRRDFLRQAFAAETTAAVSALEAIGTLDHRLRHGPRENG